MFGVLKWLGCGAKLPFSIIFGLFNRSLNLDDGTGLSWIRSSLSQCFYIAKSAYLYVGDKALAFTISINLPEEGSRIILGFALCDGDKFAEVNPVDAFGLYN